MSVTVYTKPACVQCTATKRKLDELGVEYETIDLLTTEGALEEVKALGFQQAPIVITDSDSWSGYQPERLSTLA
jgi:glutaredoxin-like protein NrdH